MKPDRTCVSPDTGVSVIMTVLNEQRHLRETVEAILAQDWPGELEAVIALGPSTDSTDEIAAELVKADPRVRTVRNPSGRTPDGLNAALAAAVCPVIVRVDGHCVLPPGYVSAAVSTMERTGADNVGGIMAAEGTTDFEKAVAMAMTSPLGVGAASFHVGGEEGPAETVYLGVFRAETLAAIGGYDPEFERAQDWEMNHRIVSSGGLVWFTPELKVSYRPRSTLKALARQYFQYGTWRREVMRRHEGTVSLRYLAAPAAVSAMALGSAVGLAAVVLPGGKWLRAGWLVPAGYAGSIAAGAALISRGEPGAVRIRVPVALAAMHCSWGVGFLTSRPMRRR